LQLLLLWLLSLLVADMKTIYIWLVAIVIAFGGGLYTGYSMYHKEPVSIAVQDVKPAPEIKQKDGSIVLEKAPQINVKPKHVLPVGSKAEREITVKLASKQPECPPVTADISIVSTGEGEKRVVVSSTDGTIVGGLDVPVIDTKLVAKPETLKWAVGASYNSDKQYGAWIDRDIGPMRVGAEIVKTNEDTLYIVKLGIRF
jgi:hypothetical protein